ncbi:MAG: penicillin-binding protein 2 [Candidatus Paceibacterota bacterium]
MIAKKEPRIGNSHWRTKTVLGCLLLLCAAVAGRLYYLQIVLGEHYRAWAQGLQSYSRQGVKIERGEIFFSGGEPLAINKDFFYAYVSPMNIKDKGAAAEQVSQALGLDKGDLLNKFNRDSLYVLLKEKLNDDEFLKIKEAKIEGVYADKKKMRYYPQGSVAGQLVGFVNDDGAGRYGLEEYYDEELSKGKSIVLNVDYNIQYQAEKILIAAREKLNAMESEAIVADPKTGAILAMAKTPNFDPNNYKDYAKDNINIFKNESCQTLFEPGSVFKGITMASALNEGKVTPDTKYTDTGILKVGPDTIYNYGHRSYGVQTMTNVLEHSINTGAAYAESQLGNQPFADYVEKFGVFEPTGIDMPETFSSNSGFKKGYAINYVTASYGQGIWMTSIQLIRAYSALANGGWLVQPSLAREGRKDNDQTKIRQVIDEKTSKTIATMLASVVDNGFGKAAKVSGYTISGKTGTAQMSWSTLGIDQRGYSDKTTQSFIGFFPSGDPKYLILTKMKAPEANTAEYSAIPIFTELAKYVVYVTQLPPNEEIKKKPLIAAPLIPAATAAAVTAAPTAETAPNPSVSN